MLAVFELRNHVRELRNIFSSEAFNARWERVNSKASELDVALLEAEVLWGNALHRQKDALRECLLTFRRSLRRHPRSQDKERDVADEQYEQIDTILNGDGDENDKFGNAIDQAVGEFEDALRPYLNRRTR